MIKSFYSHELKLNILISCYIWAVFSRVMAPLLALSSLLIYFTPSELLQVCAFCVKW